MWDFRTQPSFFDPRIFGLEENENRKLAQMKRMRINNNKKCVKKWLEIYFFTELGGENSCSFLNMFSKGASFRSSNGRKDVFGYFKPLIGESLDKNMNVKWMF